MSLKLDQDLSRVAKTESRFAPVANLESVLAGFPLTALCNFANLESVFAPVLILNNQFFTFANLERSVFRVC